MIKLENVNKYFYLGKPNQIHVINDTSMELPETGMVCLLGPSGCGKTTLLNVIGGLDKVNSGSIFIDDQRITRISADRVDNIRNAHIGYIFQNYNLLDGKTVFENVAIALNMVGINNKQIVEDRVFYCLKKVGIYQYRNRPVEALSGGQRQRVAIARAIAKNPSIIIADEPTGNLDSANTLEIMNIIKSISKDKLVILVTHEKNIAEFYADYVAEMCDGKIVKSYTNDASRSLDYQLENKIYLKDMPVQKNMSDDEVSVSVYADREIETAIKLVIRNGNLYIDTNGRFNVIDDTSNVELIDDNYKAMDESFFEETDFEYDAHLPENFKANYTSVYKLGAMLSKGWKTITGFKKMKKVLLLGFVFAAAFSFVAISNVMGIIDVQPKDYLTTSQNYITVSNPKKTDDLLKLIESLDMVDYVIPGDTKVCVNLPMDDYLQSSYAVQTLTVSLSETSTLKKSQLAYGRLPEKKNEVVLDEMLIQSFLDNKYGRGVGLTKKKQFLGRKIQINNLNDYTVVGISTNQSPTMYVDSSQIIHILTNAYKNEEDSYNDEDSDPIRSGKVKNIDLTDSKITIKRGSLPNNKNEVILSDSHEYEYKIGNTIKTKMSGEKLKLVGFYTSDKYGEDTQYVSAETVTANYIYKQKVFTVYAENVNQVQKMLEIEKIASVKNVERDKTSYIKMMKSTLLSSLIVAGIILLISLIEMFLMLRSSFMSRIKEVGTLRAIGLKKGDVYKMFTGEILVITFITAIPGILMGYYVMSKIVEISQYLAGSYMVTPIIALITFAMIIVFNLIAGLIPVFRTLRKTPAEILARTDI